MPGEGTTVVNFSVQLPEMQEATRSFTNGITALHLLVFDENGYFVEAKAATPTTSFGVVSGTTYGFSVQLSQSPNKRTIHFVANSPITDVKNYSFGSERELINALSTSDAQDAYWQRVELTDGIIAGQTEGSLAGTSLAKLTAVPLVRNFVKITVQNKAADDANGGFVLEGIALVNTPDKGTIAPYNVNSGNYAVYNSSTTYSGLNSAGYYGFEPTDMTIDTTIPTTSFVAAVTGGQDATDDDETVASYAESYMYERRMHDKPSDYTYVIIKGKYNNGTTTSYYKVDIINQEQDGAYFDLLRNFNYVIDINAVLGDGFGSAEDAAAAVASNNISASIDTQNLLNISDGKARLYVEYVDKVLTKAGTYTLKYKYVPNIANSNTVSNGYVQGGATTTDDNPVDLSTVVQGDVIKNFSVANTDVDGWRTITFETNVVDGVKNQTITIRAGALKRDIRLSLRDPFQMSVAVTGNGTALGSARTVTISLPSDRLPEAIFPLEFVIVDKNLSISPDTSKDNNNLPVKTGINADGVAVANGQYFGFVKKLEYEDYVIRDSDGNITGNLTKLDCYFITNKSDATPSVKVYNEYFTTTSN